MRQLPRVSKLLISILYEQIGIVKNACYSGISILIIYTQQMSISATANGVNNA